jgi:hypothetical protein
LSERRGSGKRDSHRYNAGSEDSHNAQVQIFATLLLKMPMELSVFKLISWIVAPTKWLFRVFIDQTAIEVVGTRPLPEHAREWPKHYLPVHDDGTGGGPLIFIVTSASKRSVEITRIEVDYAAPLQVTDPGNRGFFRHSTTHDLRLPFRVYWEGNEEVSWNLQQEFQLVARSPYPEREQTVRISVYARRRHHPLGGFLTFGRLRITRVEFQAHFTCIQLYTVLPPKCTVTSPQPFVIESGRSMLGPGGSLIAHEVLADGSTSSTPIVLPGGEAGSPGFFRDR